MAESHVGKGHIRDITATAAQQPHILEPRNALSDPIFAHNFFLS